MTYKITWMFLALSLCVTAPALAADEQTPAGEELSLESELPDPSLGDGTDLGDGNVEGTDQSAAKSSAKTNSTASPAVSTKEDLSMSEEPAIGSSGQATDNLYLPPPMETSPQTLNGGSGAKTAAYSGAAISRDESSENGMEYKPGFSLELGNAYKTYRNGINYAKSDSDPNPLNDQTRQALKWSVEPRIVHLKETLALWGHVGMMSGLDKMYRLGLIGELTVNRRFQILGGIINRQNYVWWPGEVKDKINWKIKDTVLGFGGQFEMIVGPHYSLGVRGWAEKDIFAISLVFSIEAGPSLRIKNLNYPETVF